MVIKKSQLNIDMLNLCKVLGIVLFLFHLFVLTPSFAKESVLQQLEKDFKKVVITSRPAVVKVIATHHTTAQFPNNIRKMNVSQQSISSGIILDKNGHIVTTTFDFLPNTVEIVLNNKKRLPAKFIGMDDLTDIVVLKTENKMPVQVKQGNTKQINTGSWVLTLANSRGSHPIISFGIVSGMEILPDRPCDELIKINTPISPGNSGGAVVNTSGEIVGMLLAVLSEPHLQDPFMSQFPFAAFNRPGIAFAVPIETVKSVATEIIQHGKVRRGWLGVTIETKDFGVFVTRVDENSPAHKGGILPRDVILKFEDEPVTTYTQLLRCVGTKRPNTEIKLRINRNGNEQNYTIKLGER